ncbi:hypothetical protein PSTG_15991 [Puccinia striiformis f. sp. tritici PST-78]|uniref:Protein-lysine N-methyltransferase EFM4 n=1 Tax=Puccinia striiformis f. sp. tritici PST-78 TaxID=1165861 RepID=A0A0L0UUG2_9BASI|nr:hypothetical protein PSTG_15991 [Puccinia striiformis f. sp. tritici PST-78]
MADDAKQVEVESLPPSRLGTQAFWDDNYGRELENFCEGGDEGEVWFGEASSDEILDWIARYLPSPLTPTSPSFSGPEDAIGQLTGRKDSQILDVGCGNGQLLFLLAQGGYSVDCLTGIDYSSSSIELSAKVARAKGIDGLRLEVRDILREPIEPPQRSGPPDLKGWDLITDKGTFDAICLSEDTIDGRKLEFVYPEKILDLLVKPGGIFLITSCNWTEEELIQKFVSPNIGFKFHSKIPRACFSFGGSKGSTITTIAFQASS